MTDVFYRGSQADCQFIKETLDYASDLPEPGHDAHTGIPVCTPEVAAAKRAHWRSLTAEQQEAEGLDPATYGWYGWTLWATRVSIDYTGTMYGVWLPDSVPQIISTAIGKGILLSLEQTSALLAAVAAAQPHAPPDWDEPL